MAEYNISGLPQQDAIDFKKYIRRILKNWYWFVLSLSVGMIVAWMINRYTPPVYSVHTTMLISGSSQAYQGIEGLIAELGFFRRQQRTDILTEIEVLKSYQLSHQTLEELPEFRCSYNAVGDIMETNIYDEGPFKVIPDESQKNRTNYPVYITILDDKKFIIEMDNEYAFKEEHFFGEPFKHNDFHFTIEFRDEIKESIYRNGNTKQSRFNFIFNDINQLANTYRNKLSITQSNKVARMIVLRTNGSNKKQEVDFLNKLSEVYIREELDEKNKIAEQAIDFIEEQLNTMGDTLKKEEKKLQDFRQKNDVIDISKQTEEYTEKLQDYQKSKTQLIVQENYLNYLIESVEKLNIDSLEILPVIPGLDLEFLNNKVSEFNEVILRLKILRNYVNPKSPDRVEIRKELLENKEIIRELIKKSKTFNQNQIKEHDDKIASLQESIIGIPEIEREYINIQRSYKLNDNLYTFLLEKRAEAGIAKASNVAANKQMDLARLQNAYKISPKPNSNRSKALFIGIFLPLAVLVILEVLNTKIVDKSDVDKRTNLPIIGTINHSHRDSTIPAFENPKSLIAENFRALRTNLQYLKHVNKSHSVMVTSTISGEGKTFCSINLAIILAVSNKKVLLVGLDLRRPKIHKSLGLSNEKGISTYLIGKHTREEIIQNIEVKNLDIAVSGPVPPNPAELIETEEMKNFFEEASKRYDYVIIDTPPLAIVADSLFISRYADTNLFVVRQKYSSKDVLELANDVVEKGKVKQLNIIINDIEMSGRYGYGYNYGYSYGYGYSSGYGNDYYEGYYDEEKPSKKIKKSFSFGKKNRES